MVMCGCAQPPVEQLEAVQHAVESAKAAGAAEYAREDLATLEYEFALAKEEFVGQEKVLALFQSYSDVEALLAKVLADARQVEVNAAQRKKMAKATALAVEQEAKQILASAKKFMSSTLTQKGRASRKIIEQELTGLEKNLRVVSQLIETGDYLDAEKQARTVRGKGMAISEVIQQPSQRPRMNLPT